MTTIQILVNRGSDTDALGELCPSRYEIQVRSQIHDADLYLVEDNVLSEYEDSLRARKDAASPVFCPVIVIRHSGGQRPASVTAPSEIARSNVVDDTLQAPVTRQRLVKRVESLITRREQSQKMHEQLVELEDKNQRIERIASVLAHDLRNPIQVLKGRVELIREEPAAAIDEHIQPLERSIVRIDTLTEDMLDFLQEGGSADERREVPVDEIASTAWDTTIGEGSDATLEADELDEMTIHADRGRLLQLFENLYRNAVVHGGSRVRVGPLSEDDGFYVEDDGPGIPPEERKDVFTPGYSTREEGVETGLGLSIVHNVVENHGWDIVATESDTGGARFEIRTH